MKYRSAHSFHPWLLIAILAMGMGSCSNTDCPLNNVVMTYYTLYSSSTGSQTRLSDTLTVTTSAMTLLNRSVNQSAFSLPMSYAYAQDTLYFHFSNADASVTDTVMVSHTNQPHFVSLDCGTSIFHEITSVAWSARTATAQLPHAIDSIVVIRNQVNYDQSENIRIYLSGD